MAKYLVFIVGCFMSSLAWTFTWPEATPEEVGMDPEYINETIEKIASGSHGRIRSLIIIKNGYLVTEEYFGNQGEKRPVYSVTKSVGSALLGIAKYQGADISLDSSIMNYLPQYNNINNWTQANFITLHDLLSQRHGYNWDEWSIPYGNSNNPLSQMLQNNDWYQFALEWPIGHGPNQDFAYSTGHSSLMSPILQNRTGQDVYEFAAEALFDPLNITDTHWELIDGGGTQGQGITAFPFGIEPLGFGLWLKPIDMAKIGELYRRGGVWQGQRILDQDWIDRSIQTYSDGLTDGDVFADEFSGYGYQWWRIRFTDQLNQTTDTFYADGYGRQFIMVMPELNATIVTTADDYNYSGPGIGTLLRDTLLLAFERSESDPVDITNDFNGSWHWPQHAGQGIDFQIINNNSNITGFWYTYDAETGQQRWFTLQGDVTGDVASFTLYTTTNGGFITGEPPTLMTWGSGSLVIYNCNSGLFKFDSNADNISGEIPLTRITAATGHCLNQSKGKTVRTAKMGYIH